MLNAMKMNAKAVKVRGTASLNNQQSAFELKRRVLISLNKVADRDTYQIGVEEVGKTAESLTADGVVPFLSCILDTESVQKIAVRRECVRVMGMLANLHGSLVLPHLGKMVASIVKRLKDTDSTIRDACVETLGMFSLKFGSCDAASANDGIFIGLVKPLFEAMGEQNKQVQSGAALCVARVIDNIQDPPVTILQKMLARTVKLLRNPHFMAKPAILELNTCIIQSGGAPTHASLSSALISIQEALKNTDWVTRKAASAALGELASTGERFLANFKPSCLRSLESCRFDKVKPVRDMALHALEIWRDIPGPDTGETSESSSSIRENFIRDEYIDVTSACESTPKVRTGKKFLSDLSKKRIPLSVRRSGHNVVEAVQHPKDKDWSIEVADPKIRNKPKTDAEDFEYLDSSVTKSCHYFHEDDKLDFSSASNLFTENFESKALTVCSDVLDEVNSVKTPGRGEHFVTKETGTEEKKYVQKMQDRQSLDSTVTEFSSQRIHGCCSQTASEMAFMRKQLLEIENKQSNLMEMFKVLTSNMMDTLSLVQLKVSSLEGMMEHLSQEYVHSGRFTDITKTRSHKRTQESCSPRVSASSSRPSVGICKVQRASVPRGNVGEKICIRSRQSGCRKQGADIWADSHRKCDEKSVLNGKEIYSQEAYRDQSRNDFPVPAFSSATTRTNEPWIKDNCRKVVKGYLSEGDLESAYKVALSSGDEHVLFELLDTTGPQLDSLSSKTGSDLLSTLSSNLLEQKISEFVFPWLHQVVELTSMYGQEYIALSSKTKQEILSAVQQAVRMKFSYVSEKRSVMDLALTLQQLWGPCPS